MRLLSNPNALFYLPYLTFYILEIEINDLIKNRIINCRTLGDITFNEIQNWQFFMEEISYVG